ncbi:hypothetical protein BWQ96_10517 [Gracilariopsis chorda]|uniref:Uncharacterized protein n=1 Tax=Gracilariopsis chorda TaxID=448386 RepID=A0A2V3ICF4_9FLOR|nr:hypothetical protein BWQ96_10517 [Gracilariopsis chorda]|eukprot:PXF39782.1 hypothetical protein BWQ96_10517 [Gracilariopsis chorda]
MEDFDASSLHLRPCSLEDYFNIATEDGVYDLIEGILVMKEMADQEHDRGAAFWAMTFNNEKPEKDKRVAMLNPSVEISSDSTGNSNKGSRKPTVLRPNMAIGKLPSDKQRRAVPKESQDIMFPKGYPPDLTLESTSCNPTKDLNTKPKMYLDSGVGSVHTLHRDKRGNGRNACYRIQKKENGQIVTETTPISNDPINDRDARKITSKQLMHPPSPDHNVRQNKAKQRAKTRVLRTKLNQAENRADGAENRANAEKNRADAAEKRARELQKQLEALTGNPTESSAKYQSSLSASCGSRKGSASASSSGTSSPPRQRQKRSNE